MLYRRVELIYDLNLAIKVLGERDVPGMGIIGSALIFALLIVCKFYFNLSKLS